MANRLLAVGRGLALGCVALLLALLVWKVTHPSPGASFVAKVEQGDTPSAPDLGLPVLSAGTMSLSPGLASAIRSGHVSTADLGGRPTVVNFFASYCLPCREEAPQLAAQARRLSGQVVFLGVAYQDYRSDAKRLLAKSGASYPVLYDGPGKTESTWGLTGIPETFVLSADGRVIEHLIGRLSQERLAHLVAVAIGSA